MFSIKSKEEDTVRRWPRRKNQFLFEKFILLSKEKIVPTYYKYTKFKYNGWIYHGGKISNNSEPPEFNHFYRSTLK